MICTKCVLVKVKKKKNFFSFLNNTPKPDTSYQRWGGTLGGPIVRNKIHFFGSLERFAIDRPNTINIPSRPEYEKRVPKAGGSQ